MKKIISLIIFLPFFFGCKKPKPGTYITRLIGSTNSIVTNSSIGDYQEWQAILVESNPKHLTYSSSNVNGTLNKRQKKVSGILTFGPITNPTYTLSIDAVIKREAHGEYSIEGTYLGGANETDTNNNVVYNPNYYKGNIRIFIP
jgi:hypothetical protein